MKQMLKQADDPLCSGGTKWELQTAKLDINNLLS